MTDLDHAVVKRSVADHTATDRPADDRTRVNDLRLLIPALVAWSLLALTVGWPTRTQWLTVGLLAVALVSGLVASAVQRGRRRRRAHDRQRRWPSHRALSRRAATWQQVLFALAVTLLLQLGGAGQGALRASGDLAELTADRAVVTIDATITADPKVAATSRREDSAAVVVFVRADATMVRGRGRVSAAHAPVTLRGSEELTRLAWHQRVRVTGRLAPADPAYGDLAVVRVSAVDVLAQPGLVARGAEHLRQGLRDAVDQTPSDSRGLLPGLVIGDTSRSPPDLTEAMQATGMTHLTAVSGSNISVVAGIVLGGCVFLGVPRRLRPWIIAAAIVGFVVLARPEPSVVRAATMGLIGLIGLSRSRRGAGIPVLAGAVVVVLVIDPWMARSFGFALSALATLGLLLFTRPWGDAIAQRLPGRVSWLGPAIAIPIAAQAMCAPLIVVLQGSVSVIGVLANLVAAPFVAPATIAGVAAALLSVVADGPAQIAGWCGAVPTLVIARTARVMADVPGGTLPWPDGPPGALLLAGLTVLIILTGRWIVRTSLAKPLAALTVVALTAALTVPTQVVAWPPQGWQLVACDVGQGDATVIRTAPGHALVVDAGPEPDLIQACLDDLDVRVIDAVVLTHFHADHVDGLEGILASRTVGQVLVTPVAQPAYQARQVSRWTQAHGIPIHVIAAGDTLRFGAATAWVWAPARRISAGSVPNNSSVVLAVRVGRVSALLLGDIEREAGRDLVLRMRRDAQMRSAATQFDLVKTPHHGSSNLDPALMSAVRSPVAVISVGKDNDYGHPAAAHLEMLRRFGYAAYRTDQRGHVALVERDGEVGVQTLTSP